MGLANWAKMTSPRGKLTALMCHPTIKINKAEQLTYLSTNSVQTLVENIRIALKAWLVTNNPMLIERKVSYSALLIS